MDNILEVSGLNKRYGDFALKDISFYLPDGCITGFVGINGAGKTTTLRSILGLTNKVSGNIKFFGMDMDGNESKIKDRIGIVFDEGCFYDELTFSEMKNVIAPAYRNWCEQDFIDYMEQFSLNPKQKINTLSKGMRMKYALALALSHKAELLIMDEPTSGLDPLVRSQLLNILKDYMGKGGKGVFFSTHITSDLEKIADTVCGVEYVPRSAISKYCPECRGKIRKAQGTETKRRSRERNRQVCIELSAKNDRLKKNKYHGDNYSEEELAALLELTRSDLIYPAIILAGCMGLRRSEALGLRWSRIDWEQNTVLLDTKVVEYERDGEKVVEPVEEMKNKSSRRTLPLPGPVREMLETEKEKQEIYRKMFGNSYDLRYLDYVCVDQLGRLIRPSYVTQHFSDIIKKYGLRKLTFHGLRHTMASILISHDVPLINVSNFLGHSDISTTANIYAHLDKASKQASADIITDIFKKDGE